MMTADVVEAPMEQSDKVYFDAEIGRAKEREEAEERSKKWSVEPWYHAFYHTTTSVLGFSAVAALPGAFAYLGWAGGLILLIASTLVSNYSGNLLISIQEAHHKTYSEIADATMYPGFSKWFIRPLQLIQFFQVGILGALIIGQSLQAIDMLVRNGDPGLSLGAWIGIAGAAVFAVALVPTLSQLWQVSLLGAVTAVGLTIFAFVACGVAIAQGSREDIHFGRPSPVGTDISEQADFTFGVLVAFGIIAFAYGGHSVLPDVQASLHNSDIMESHRSMMKGFTFAYFIIFPCYLLSSIVGYAAFGAEVNSFLVYSFQDYVSDGIMMFLWILIILNILAMAAVYLQAAFKLIEDIVPNLAQHFDGRLNYKQVIMRFTFIALATFVAVALPFFGDLSALIGALCITPLTFVYPFMFWNRSKNAEKASVWVMRLNWFCGGSFALLGLGGAIGALYLIVIQSSTYRLFQ